MRCVCELIEVSAALEAEQRATLAGEDVPIAWSRELGTQALPGPTIVIANEFLDALPARAMCLACGPLA